MEQLSDSFSLPQLLESIAGWLWGIPLLFLLIGGGIFFTFYFSTNFSDLISVRIAIGSGTAFIIAQLIDVNIFDKLRNRIWFAAPLISSLIGSTIDTFLFFSIAFYGTGLNWIALSFGDLFVKIFMALLMLIPFRILINYIKDDSIFKKKASV